MKQELLIFLDHLSSPPVYWWGSVLLIVLVFLCCPNMRLHVLSFVLWCPLRCSVSLYHQLFVGGRTSHFRYLCLFVHSGVQHTLCCVFVLFFFVLCTLCCQFLWISLFWLPLPYSLTFIYYVSMYILSHQINQVSNINVLTLSSLMKVILEAFRA